LRADWLRRVGLTPEAFEQLVAGLQLVPNQPGEWPPLLYAAATGDEAEARRLLSACAFADAVNDRGETPLMWAARRGHAAIVSQLLAAGADTNAIASRGRADPKIRDKVSRWRRDPKEAAGQTALMWAAECGQVQVIRLLLDGSVSGL